MPARVTSVQYEPVMHHYIIDSRTARVFLRETGNILRGYAGNCLIGGDQGMDRIGSDPTPHLESVDQGSSVYWHRYLRVAQIPGRNTS